MQAKEGPKGQIPIADCVSCELSTDLKKHHCFVVKTMDRNLYAYAETDGDMNSWMEALRKVMPDKTSIRTTMYDIGAFKANENVNEAVDDDEWQLYHTDEGYEYWYNEKSGESMWEQPPSKK